MDKLIRDTLNEVLDEIISEENNIINVIPESGGEEESGGGGGEEEGGEAGGEGEGGEEGGGGILIPPRGFMFQFPPTAIQFIISGLGNGMRNMNILDRSFREHEVIEEPLCQEFRKTLTDIPITKENENKYTCAICQENLIDGDVMVQLPCKGVSHCFHKGDEPDKCGGIMSWFDINHKCPICRTDFPKEPEEGGGEEGGGEEGGGEEGGGEEGGGEEGGGEEGGGEEGGIVFNVPLNDIIQAGGVHQIMNHIMRNLEEQRYDDDIQAAILRSFEES
jgi:hypothetical protein